MKMDRKISEIKALLTRALECNDSELVKQYTWGLFFMQSERIRELEKELTIQKLQKYRKVG